jgi:transposase
LLKRLRDRVATHLTLAPSLEMMLTLRLALTSFDPAQTTAEPAFDVVSSTLNALLQTRRAVMLLPSDADPRLLAQCDALAASVQNRVRLAVMPLPDAKRSLNTRGALELITWQTGLSCATGGIDFSDSAPRPSPPLHTLLDRQAIDLLIDCNYSGDPLADHLNNTTKRPARITLGPTPDPTAEVSFITPGLVLGLSARVMRFDGIVLWLCDDPSSAPPDPTAQLLHDLLQSVQQQPANTR